MLLNGDIINALFELFGGILLWKNVHQLHKDKEIKGVHWSPVMFLAAWGYWNLYYYPSLDQWFSFVAGINIVAANTVWVVQMLYYIRKNKNESYWQ